MVTRSLSWISTKIFTRNVSHLICTKKTTGLLPDNCAWIGCLTCFVHGNIKRVEWLTGNQHNWPFYFLFHLGSTRICFLLCNLIRFVQLDALKCTNKIKNFCGVHPGVFQFDVSPLQLQLQMFFSVSILPQHAKQQSTSTSVSGYFHNHIFLATM